MNRTLLKTKHGCEFSAAKKIHLLLLILLCAHTILAENCMSIKQISTNYKTKTVTFDVTWNTCNGSNHLYKAWIFVDYCEVNSAGKPVEAWQRAALNGTVSYTTGTYAAGNSTGFYLTGSYNGQVSRVTVPINTGSVSRFNWCAFATDYPPQVSNFVGDVTFKGTLPFALTYCDDSKATATSKNYTLTKKLTSFSDATGNLGIIPSYSGCSNPSFCTGSAGFVSTTTWKVGTQEWSAPVTATYCRKTSYNGGSSSPFNADCRSNNSSSTIANSTYGDLFSWCMVMQYASQLCPNGWRVPTYDDFCTLDKTLNNRANCNNRDGDVSSYNRYISNQWNGACAGYCSPSGGLTRVETGLFMWTGTINSSTQNVYRFHYCCSAGGVTAGDIYIDADSESRGTGVPLRCVRNL